MENCAFREKDLDFIFVHNLNAYTACRNLTRSATMEHDEYKLNVAKQKKTTTWKELHVCVTRHANIDCGSINWTVQGCDQFTNPRKAQLKAALNETELF